MSNDYKYEAQLHAEQAAEDRFGSDFFSLSQEKRDALYEEGLQDWVDAKIAKAEMIRDQQREP